MNLDLRSYQTILADQIRETANRFGVEHPEASVAALQVQFDIDPGGYLLNIETREKYQPDSWDEMPFALFAEFTIEEWCAFDAAIFTEPCTLATHCGDILQFLPNDDGCSYRISGDECERYGFQDEGDHFIQATGLMFVDVITDLCRSGGFASWNLRPNAVFEVDEVHAYFWRPSVEQRLLPLVATGTEQGEDTNPPPPRS